VLGENVGCGVVYEMSPPPRKGGQWTETVVYSFQGGNDGYFPIGNLIFDQAGNLYGATWFGGGGGGSSCDPYYQYCGTIFELSPPKQMGGAWTEKLLYSFQNGSDGGQPNGGLTFDKHGALYGTTYCGGKVACNGNGGTGAVFELKPPIKKGRWTYQVVYSFPSDGSHGAGPASQLVFDSKGNLYGTAVSAGPNRFGVVFELMPTGTGHPWNQVVLYGFTGGSDGGLPNSGVIFHGGGALYGTTSGSKSPGGEIYRLYAQGQTWKLDVVYNFKGAPDGYDPGGVTFGPAGDLYGTTLYGGTGTSCQGGCGTVFAAKP
jgi:hypothetical protein